MRGARTTSSRRESNGFAIGSALFAVGALPGYLGLVGESADNVTFAIGAVFFTAAAFIQLRLSRGFDSESRAEREDWRASLVQFVGTLAFNLTTLAALSEHPSPIQADRAVWAPDAVGSVCFLASSWFAIRAASARHQLRRSLRQRDALALWLNAAGAVAFAISAVASFVLPATNEVLDQGLVNAGTFLGALCFLTAALAVRPRRPPPTPNVPQ